MRLIKQIPHERFFIQLHAYNNKFILSIELDNYVQSFKLPLEEMADIENFEQKITPEFLSACLKRFIEMRQDWVTLNQK
ncbi:MAG: hypothetical protein RL264_45 [Bacteroidota bacterium]|jgi:hypothetical protein